MKFAPKKIPSKISPFQIGHLKYTLPADGRLAVGGAFSSTQCLPHLGLGQAQGEASDLESFGEFSDLLQVDPINLAGGRLGV